ncbi:MAG: hypothetical protein HY891_00570, partial [Deltaproteobacteria bacterium]|nr:hypothetical protein [Deltaproteobacteria bacterium]
MRSLYKIFSDWFSARENAGRVLGMNERNLRYIYVCNSRKDFPLADHKLLTKDALRRIGVPVPATYKVYSHFYELQDLEAGLAAFPDFVIKPAQGSGGGGIVVIARREGRNWISVSGKAYSLHDLRRHISDIIFGVHSFDLHDQAIIEERVVQNSWMSGLSPLGLADIRVILCRDEPVMSMTRIPTKASNGKANLHQGAIGVGIDIATGRTVHAIHGDRTITAHPDTGAPITGLSIPHWEKVLDVSRKIARAVPLKYLGVDIALTEDGVVVLEINVRPGLQIQNANLRGLRETL